MLIIFVLIIRKVLMRVGGYKQENMNYQQLSIIGPFKIGSEILNVTRLHPLPLLILMIKSGKIMLINISNIDHKN